MLVVSDVVLTESQGCWCLVGVIESQVQLVVSPSAPNLKLQELGDVEQQTEPEGG